MECILRGLFQEARGTELAAIVRMSTIDFVLLTHGHLDHCSWLPRLVDQGFKGKIYCSGPTKKLPKLILLDR
jgi:metallo-beta-lactamase family protein